MSLFTSSSRSDSATVDLGAAAALAFTRDVLEMRGHVSDAAFAAIREAGFRDTAIVEIVACVAMNAFANSISNLAQLASGLPQRAS